MNRDNYFILSLSIVLPAIIGLVRFKKIETTYQPFLYLIFVSVINEAISFFLPQQPKKFALLDLNVFTLFEYCILLFQFYKWKIFERHTLLFYALLTGFLLVWLTENFLISSITTYNFYYILLHSFVMVILSINTLNRTAVNSFDPLYKNAQFIICIGLIIFFIYNMVVNALFLVSKNPSFAIKVFNIRVYVNVLSNLLFAAGIYFIPVKLTYKNFFKKE
jgi:hypothetical protein